MFVKCLQDDLTKLRFKICNQNASTTDILSPFKEILSQPTSTDAMTLIAVISIMVFLENKLIHDEIDFNSLIQALCNCQYQLTSEIESLNLSVQILRCFCLIIQSENLQFITIDSIESIFHYCEQDIRQLSQRNVHSSILSDLFCQVSYIISEDSRYTSIRENVFRTLFSIADLSYIDSGSYARGAALRALLRCSKADSVNNSTDMICITSVLLTQQLDFSDSRDNLVMSLRLFYSVFRRQWRTKLVPFTRLLNSLLDICISNVPSSIKAIIFEVIIDFITEDNFFLEFFSEFYERPFFPLIFEKFLTVISMFANVPPSVPDVHFSAVNILSIIISNIKKYAEKDFIMNKTDSSNNKWEKEAELLEKLTSFSKKFQEDPKFLQDSQISPPEAAFCLAVAPGIQKQAIGELFSKNTPFSNDTMTEFIKLFDFSSLDFDESIRLFLTSFRILGEGQVVDRNLEYFSKIFYESHKNDKNFKNVEAVHILSYGWLMLHTSLYNQNVTKKNTLPEFFTMLKGQNDGDDFDSQFLTKIYNSVKRHEVEIGDDTNRTIASWNLLLQKQRILELKYSQIDELQNKENSQLQNKFSLQNDDKNDTLQNDTFQKSLRSETTKNDLQNNSSSPIKNDEKDLENKSDNLQITKSDSLQNNYNDEKDYIDLEKLFRQIWKIAAPIFSILYEKSPDSIDIISSSFLDCSYISSKYQLHDILDNIVVSLCKFTGYENKSSLSEITAKSALKTLSSLVSQFGDQINEGWKSFCEVLLSLFRLNLLPDEFCQQPIIIGQPNMVTISPNLFSSNSNIKNNFSSSFLSIFKIYEKNDTFLENDNSNTSLMNDLKDFISNCKFDSLVNLSITFSSQSLNYLIQSLSLLAKETMTKQIFSDSLFCLHLISQIIITNCDRVLVLWPFLHQLFISIFNDSFVQKNSVFLERISTILFLTINHLWPQIKIRQDLIKLTDILVVLDNKQLNPLLLSGFKEFLNLFLDSYIEMHQFKSLNQLLYNSIQVQNPSSSQILHTFISGVISDSKAPSLDRFAEYWMPLVQTNVIYCLRNPNSDFNNFNDLQSLVNFGGNSPTNLQWEFVFESTLFPALEVLPNEISIQWNTGTIGARSLLLTKCIFKVFLISYKEMLDLPSFEQLWFKFVQLSLNVMKVGDSDLKASIPQLLTNALIVMKSSGVFEGENRTKMWNDSKELLEPVAPYFSQLCKDL
ncbi:Sec7 domain containing protein [Trichomonas vaginalis G3]|uniref:Sec7 domain containing protein n=1 Tax=Trichomonas vaginalis (strain ATCC PRA-98 / G3) TaxID=412133 RepID=A2ERU0_TRIV3|nr:regulation of ARF protein signal transduction [Trichomonas vaginalis G3]EAY04607.1 Sec7 domain containing protein [Trichomonas vaginalis G3]KAI5539629.1 regulation of ARF protein signal transduction [Trichomonas vaginalis G3]|eukprot:XP_001316830.1 Sec7 domain containing protein [Trichomonas vaginalis G3]